MAKDGFDADTRATRGSLLRRLGRFRLLASEEGQNLVENAVSLLIFFALLMGAIEFSYALYTYHCVADSARQAARWASVRGSESCSNVSTLPDCDATSAEITSYVQGLGYPGINSSGLSVTPKWCTGTFNGTSDTTTWAACTTTVSNAPGNEVQVTVTYSFPITLAYLKATTISLTSTGTIVIAQ